MCVLVVADCRLHWHLLRDAKLAKTSVLSCAAGARLELVPSESVAVQSLHRFLCISGQGEANVGEASVLLRAAVLHHESSPDRSNV